MKPTNRTREEVWLLQEKYSGVPSKEYESDRLRLLSGEPLAYIIGWTPFLGAHIDLSSRPLIPRPETEYWTERAIEHLRTTPKKGGVRALDLFAGSGAIGAVILKNIPEAHVTFGEIEEKHLPTIQKNALSATAGDANRFCVIKSDVWESIDGAYDIILANPPYIPQKSPYVEESVSTHEPHEALFGGSDGLLFIQKCIEGVAQHLTPNGTLWCEHDHTQGAAVQKLLENIGYGAETHKDQYGIPRYTVGIKKV